MAALTVLAIAATLAATGAQVHASREAKREAKGNERDMKYQAGQESLKLDDKKKVDDAEIGVRAARARQRAMSAANGTQGLSSTINTSPLGLSGSNAFGGKDAFGG